MERHASENIIQSARDFLSNSNNMTQLKLLLCNTFNPDSIKDPRQMYFMKRIYSKFTKVRNNTSQYLAHLEKVQK